MKIRKLKGDWRSNEDAQSACQMVMALRAARDASASVSDAGEFQARCNDAILALANLLMEVHVERFYEPETKKFEVTYDVKRNGTGVLVVEAKDEAEARAIAQNNLSKTADVHFDEVPTEIIAIDVVEAKEVPDDRA